jgi:hypothetical protein
MTSEILTLHPSKHLHQLLTEYGDAGLAAQPFTPFTTST